MKMAEKKLLEYSNIIMIVFLITVCYSGRVRRVINGDVMQGRDTGYSALKYYAAIGTVHGLTFYNFFIKGPTNRGDVSCSGALITPGIVQTACHCLSYWEDQRQLNGFRRPLVEHNWEGYRVLYVGVNDQFGQHPSMETVNPITSRQFVVHQKCAEYRNNMMTHDYGWIVIDPTWNSDTSGVPIGNMVGFAPLYPKDELAKIWKITTEKTAVCLHMGFGTYDINKPDSSPYLLHGWGVMLRMRECWMVQVHGIFVDDVEQYLNFFCSKTFSRHNQPVGRGDSGGPVTCGMNVYFGVVSGSAHNLRLASSRPNKVHVSYDGAIYFAPFENAAEYRRDFVRFMRDSKQLPYAELVSRYEDSKGTFKQPAEGFSGNIQLKSDSFTWAHTNYIILFVTTCITTGIHRF